MKNLTILPLAILGFILWFPKAVCCQETAPFEVVAVPELYIELYGNKPKS